MNSLFQQLAGMQQAQQQMQQPQQSQKSSFNSQNNNTNSMKELFKAMANGGNPANVIQSLVQSNPKMQGIMNMFNSSGMTPKDFFYQYAQQNGVDPNQFVNSLLN